MHLRFDLCLHGSWCAGGNLISCAFHLSVAASKREQLLMKSQVIISWNMFERFSQCSAEEDDRATLTGALA